MDQAKLITINVRDFGGDAKTKSIFDFAKRSKSDFIFLQETLVAPLILSRFYEINGREKVFGRLPWANREVSPS